MSFRYHTGETVSVLDESGVALTDTGVQTEEETRAQMQEEETVAESQKEGTTVLDEAVKAGQAEIKKWEKKSAALFSSSEKENLNESSQSIKENQK